MDMILINLKNKWPGASSVQTLGLFSIKFKHVYWYIQQISCERLQDIGPLVLIFAQNMDCGHTLKPP